VTKNRETKLQVLDWGQLEYGRALERQRELVAARIAGRAPDSLVFVEHPPSVTLGRGGGEPDLCVSRAELERRGVAIFNIERGGRATFHGPGQMVAYPIVKLGSRDLHEYLNLLLRPVEEILTSFGLRPQRKAGQPGLWVEEAKIASVGIAVSKWVTFHGVALNVNNDLGGFDLIVTCGQPDERVTSLSRQIGQPLAMAEVKDRFARAFRRSFGYESPDGWAGGRPPWLVRPAVDRQAAIRMEKSLQSLNLATVCQSAHCPNQEECFARGVATFMILGVSCTRACRFCAVDKGAPQPVDAMEPARVARAVQQMGLKHLVVTSVTRDDLADGGAGQFAQTIREVRRTSPQASVEVLTPDFQGSLENLELVCAQRPDVFNHNVETVPRLYCSTRPEADYQRSLNVLSHAAGQGLFVKSGLMLGLGESGNEVRRVLEDLHRAGCAAVTIGQYLAPSRAHQPAARYASPDEFEYWARYAREIGFAAAASAPLVRSSYRAGEMLAADTPHNANAHNRR
jgi:lipoic acid synthetase